MLAIILPTTEDMDRNRGQHTHTENIRFEKHSSNDMVRDKHMGIDMGMDDVLP